MLIEVERLIGHKAYRVKIGRFLNGDDRHTTIANAVAEIESDMLAAYRAYCTLPDSMLTQEGRLEKEQLRLLFE